MSTEIEAWTTLFTPALSQSPLGLADRAATLQRDGWDGVSMFDSQSYTGDVFMVLALAAARTSTLKLGTGTSNVVTRHPAVLANAAATLQAMSEGRMTLGVARGDASLSTIGARPTRLALFESTLLMIRRYLHGEGVSVEEAASLVPGVSPSSRSDAPIGEASDRSELMWLRDDLPTVDVEVTASGPKVIALAARHADRIALCVGADTALVSSALTTAREELDRCGRDPDSVRFSAYIPLFPHSDPHVATALSAGKVSMLAQYSGASSDDFAILGEPEQCVDRIAEIASMGIDRFHFWVADDDQVGAAESYASVIEDVLPHMVDRSPSPASGRAAHAMASPA